MRFACTILIFIAVAACPARAQTQLQPPAETAKPYKAVTVSPPAHLTDPTLDALRQKIAAAAEKRNRAALGALVVPGGFFWERENGDGAVKSKSGLDNLATALGLANKDGAGWDMLMAYAEDPTAAPSPDHKGAVCAPADPGYDRTAFDKLLDETQTDVSEWGYPVSPNIEVHAKPQASAPVLERLPMAFVRVMPESAPVSAAYLRIVTPAGKIGYVSVDALAPIGHDQLCYVKDAGVWKIGGYIGGGDPQ